ncbi:helix-turn-helix domain-containing protein [Yinghuangia aomiensis]
MSAADRESPLPHSLLNTPAMRRACADRDIGAIFTLARDHAGLTQSRLARLCEMTPSRVGDYIRGRARVRQQHVVERVADALRIPGELLGLAPRPWEDGESRPRIRSPGTAPQTRRQRRRTRTVHRHRRGQGRLGQPHLPAYRAEPDGLARSPGSPASCGSSTAKARWKSPHCPPPATRSPWSASTTRHLAKFACRVSPPVLPWAARPSPTAAPAAVSSTRTTGARPSPGPRSASPSTSTNAGSPPCGTSPRWKSIRTGPPSRSTNTYAGRSTVTRWTSRWGVRT